MWIDAQLPPALATWLQADWGVEAVHAFALGLHGAADRQIFDEAREARVVVLSKDADFATLVHREGPPPQVVWVTAGNVSNRALRTLISDAWADTSRRLRRGDAIVELGARRVPR